MKRHKGKRLEIWKPAAGEHSITIFPPDGGLVLERTLWDVKQEPITPSLRHEDSGHIPCTGKFCDICSMFAQLSAKLKDFEDLIWAAMAKLWQPYYRQQIAAMMENEDA